MAREKLDITKHSVNLRAGDYDFLQAYCQGKDIDASAIIRAQVSKIVETLRAKQNAVIQKAAPTELNEL